MAFDQYGTANRPYAVWSFNPSTSGWVMGQNPAGQRGGK